MPSIRLVATDMDGTLTQAGKFASRLMVRLEALQTQNIPVVIVTGRSAGWVSALMEYLPIMGAIAENGGYLFTAQHLEGIPLINLDRQLRSKLQKVFQHLQHPYPSISPSADNPFRITDWTFDRGTLSSEALTDMQQRCQDLGWGFTYSSIQCHIKLPQQSKQVGLLRALAEHFEGNIQAHQLLTIGDSPNDAELLDQSVFPYSVGVANLEPYVSTMSSQPYWISSKPELAGFLEITEGLLNRDKRP